MLNPKKKNEHLIYGDILVPPAEYPILEKAISTTYSLDISALVSCMIPLAFSDDVNSRLFQNKVSTLTALRNLSEKLVVFCDPSQIKTLKTRNQEFAILLEKMIVPVMLNKVDNGYPSFHSKMWLLQFTNNRHEHFYRLIILSRNISYDKCYDVSLVLESYTEKRGKGLTERSFKKTKNILDYIEYLIKVSELSEIQKRLISELINQMILEQVGFKIDDKTFDSEDWDIYPIYENTFRKDRKLFQKTILSNKDGYKKLFVMSPFISKEILEELSKSLIQKNTSDKRIKFITRQDQLNGLDMSKYSDLDFYVLNSSVISGEESKIEDNPESEQENSCEEDLTAEEKLHDIHAKIFLTESKEEKELFIGSANATNSAFNRNNELVIRLKSTSNTLNVDNFFKDINTDKGNMFLPAQIGCEDTEDLSLQKAVEDVIREISHTKAEAEVIKNTDKYSIRISFEKELSFKDISVSIKTISGINCESFSKEILFNNLNLSDISEFYYVSAKSITSQKQVERLLKIPTKNIPYEERDSELINQVITDKESFTEYVTLLLSQDSISTQIELAEAKNISAKWKITNTQMPLYETLLKASVINPQSVLSLGKDLELIKNKEIVSEDFKQLYDEFRKAIEK